MNADIMEKIMEETRKLFIIETRNKATKSYLVFINYCTLPNENDRFLLEIFFHSVKGSAGITGFMELSLYCKDFEIFMKQQKDITQITAEDQIYIFTGLCKILTDVNKLHSLYLEKQDSPNIPTQTAKEQQPLQASLHKDATNHQPLQASLNEETTNQQPIQASLNEDTTNQQPIQASLHKDATNQQPLQGLPTQTAHDLNHTISSSLTLEHSNGNILIIDDDVVLLDHLERSLGLAGYKTYITTSPDEVQLIISSKEIDIIVIDILLPQKSGFEIFESIKKCNYEGGVVFLTSKTETDDKLSGLKMGADDYITKPFSTLELIARLDRIIKTKLLTSAKINKDDMTNAYSRRFFYENFKNALHKLETSNTVFSVVLLDIDNFRDINRKNGFFVGDMILRKFVDELKNNFKEEMIFRLESDKFIILLEHIDSVSAYNILDEILSTLQTKYFAPLKTPISFSSIIYNVENIHESLETVLTSLWESLESSKIFGSKKIDMVEKELEIFRKPRILIVDDESVSVYLIKKRLEEFGYDIFYANDGVDAIGKVRQLKPDVVLLDLMLPKINGFDVTKLIREDESLKATKIMVISAKNDEKDVLRCYELGVNDYIHKPFAFKDLEKRLIRLLKTKNPNIQLKPT